MHLISHGNRDYFFDQKNKYTIEISRLTNLLKDSDAEKLDWKNKFMEKDHLFNKTVDGYEVQLAYWQDKVFKDKTESEVQTHVDTKLFNKMVKNHESVLYYKNLNSDLLRDSIEKVKFHCSTAKSISKETLLGYISDFYCDKINYDFRNSLLGPNQKAKFNDIIYHYMKEKFNIHNVIKIHCEEVILSTIKYKSIF